MKNNCILVLRPDNIGDVVLFSGALQHIRNLYPDSYITLAVQAHIINLVELCPCIDNCIPVEHLTWWGQFKSIRFPRLKEVIHGLNWLWNSVGTPYDIVIYPVKSPNVSNLEAIYCLHAKQVVGISGCTCNTRDKQYPSKYRPEVLFTDFMDVSTNDPWTHELNITLEYLRFLGCRITKIDDIKPQFWLSDTEKNCLDGAQRDDRKIIGLFPSASFEGKRWESSNYGELASLLGGQPIYAIFGSTADNELASRVALSIRECCKDVEVMNLTGQTTLRELAKAILSCDLLISMDTSGLHMAIAAGISTIGIVGGGHYGRFVPWGDPEKNIFLTQEMECFHCNWVCSKEDVECVKGVPPCEVAQAAKKLLKYETEN